MSVQVTPEAVAKSVEAIRPDWLWRPTAAMIVTRWANLPLHIVSTKLHVAAWNPNAKTPAVIDSDGPWNAVATAAHGRAATFTPATMCAEHPAHRAGSCPVCFPVAACLKHERHVDGCLDCSRARRAQQDQQAETNFRGAALARREAARYAHVKEVLFASWRAELLAGKEG